MFFLPIAIAENAKPNILFILADDVGYEGLNCYGGESYPTPQLDALASDVNPGDALLQHASMSPNTYIAINRMLSKRYR